MDREGDNENDKYYVLIQTRSGQRIVKPNRFGQAAAISLVLLNFQWNAFLQNLQTGPIDTIKNEWANVSIFTATMDHMNLISRNCDDESINLADPIILTAETSQKDNPHFGKAMKADDSEDFMKAMEKETKYLTTQDVWKILPKSSLPTSAPIIRFIWISKRKRNPFGDLIEHKDRLCVHGGMQQEGIDLHNTFAPVVNWSTVRLLVMMAEMDWWESR